MGNGYLTGNMMIPFPFEDWHGAGELPEGADAEMLPALRRCFVDAQVILSHDIAEDGSGWPSIGRISASGSELSFSVSACGFNEAISVRPSLEEFPVLYGKAEFGSYVIVLSSDGMRELCGFLSSPPAPGFNSSPGEREGDVWFRLCVRCITAMPRGLSSIKVYDGVRPSEFDTSSRAYSIGDECRRNGTYYMCTSNVPANGAWSFSDWQEIKISDVYGRKPDFVLSGDITLAPGNNMVLARGSGVGMMFLGGGGANGVGINAVPGGGLGRIPCSCVDSGPKSMLAGPDGNVKLFNDTCYDWEPGPIGEIDVDGEKRKSRSLIMHAKCTACCTCGMYESIVNDRLGPLYDAVKEARDEIGGLLEDYESAVGQFNDRMSEPSLPDISLCLAGMPVGSNLSPKLSSTRVRGRMSRCAFTATIRNSSYFKVDATIYTLSGTDTIVEASVSWSDDEGTPKTTTSASSSGIVGSTFRIGPGRSAVVTFISVKDGYSGTAEQTGYTGSISVGISYLDGDGTSHSLGVLSKTVEV